GRPFARTSLQRAQSKGERSLGRGSQKRPQRIRLTRGDLGLGTTDQVLDAIEEGIAFADGGLQNLRDNTALEVGQTKGKRVAALALAGTARRMVNLEVFHPFRVPGVVD